MSDSDPNINIAITTTADTTGAKETAGSIQQVWGATDGTKGATKGLTEELKVGTEAHESYRGKQREVIEGLHMVSLLTGGEVREGLHESTLGLRLLASLTGEMSMGIVGAALGAGSTIAMGANALKDYYNKAQEEAKKFSDEMAKTLEKEAADYGKLIATRMEDDHKAATAKIENEALLATTYREADKAQSAASIAAQDNAAKLAQAEKLVAAALGIRIDAYKEIQRLAGIEAEKLQLTAKEAEDEANAKMQLAVNAATKQTETIALRATELRQAEDLLAKEQERLETLRKQKDEMEMQEAARQKTHFDPVANAGIASYPGQVAGIDLQISGAQSAVAQYQETVKKLQQERATDEASFTDINKQLTDAESARQTQNATLKANLSADTTLADAKQVEAEVKENLTSLAAVTGNVTETTAMERNALLMLQQVQGGQTLTVQQIPLVVAALQQMAGSIQLGFATVHGTTADAVSAINALQRNLERQRQDMARVKAQIGM